MARSQLPKKERERGKKEKKIGHSCQSCRHHSNWHKGENEIEIL